MYKSLKTDLLRRPNPCHPFCVMHNSGNPIAIIASKVGVSNGFTLLITAEQMGGFKIVQQMNLDDNLFDRELAGIQSWPGQVTLVNLERRFQAHAGLYFMALIESKASVYKLDFELNENNTQPKLTLIFQQKWDSHYKEISQHFLAADLANQAALGFFVLKDKKVEKSKQIKKLKAQDQDVVRFFQLNIPSVQKIQYHQQNQGNLFRSKMDSIEWEKRCSEGERAGYTPIPHIFQAMANISN